MEKRMFGVEENVRILTAIATIIYLSLIELTVIEPIPSVIILTQTLCSVVSSIQIARMVDNSKQLVKRITSTAVFTLYN